MNLIPEICQKGRGFSFYLHEFFSRQDSWAETSSETIHVIAVSQFHVDRPRDKSFTKIHEKSCGKASRRSCRLMHVSLC